MHVSQVADSLKAKTVLIFFIPPVSNTASDIFLLGEWTDMWQTTLRTAEGAQWAEIHLHSYHSAGGCGLWTSLGINPSYSLSIGKPKQSILFPVP